jgi:CheY-like chemotaxis protein
MSTVLVIEDQFIEGFELEHRLNELGYDVELAATRGSAFELFRQLESDLAAIVCDNRLIGGEPMAAALYRHVRANRCAVPFIVYSAFPPQDLPKNDPLLKVVAKPFSDDVIAHVRKFTARGSVPAAAAA